MEYGQISSILLKIELLLRFFFFVIFFFFILIGGAFLLCEPTF